MAINIETLENEIEVRLEDTEFLNAYQMIDPDGYQEDVKELLMDEGLNPDGISTDDYKIHVIDYGQSLGGIAEDVYDLIEENEQSIADWLDDHLYAYIIDQYNVELGIDILDDAIIDEDFEYLIDELDDDYDIRDLEDYINENDEVNLLQKIKSEYIMLSASEREELFDLGDEPDVNDLTLHDLDYDIVNISHPYLEQVVSNYIDAHPNVETIDVHDIYKYMFDNDMVYYEVKI